MKTILEFITFILVIKGIAYVLFPVWIQRYIAENIINMPINRLKVLGFLQLVGALALYIFIDKRFGG